MRKALKKGDGIPFTQVSNEALNDKRLSFKAKGLYSYLYSKPYDWDFSAEKIAEESKDGRDSIQSTLRELESCGYLQRKKLSSGRMKYTIDSL